MASPEGSEDKSWARIVDEDDEYYYTEVEKTIEEDDDLFSIKYREGRELMFRKSAVDGGRYSLVEEKPSS